MSEETTYQKMYATFATTLDTLISSAERNAETQGNHVDYMRQKLREAETGSATHRCSRLLMEAAALEFESLDAAADNLKNVRKLLKRDLSRLLSNVDIFHANVGNEKLSDAEFRSMCTTLFTGK